jgi:ABC-type branched-subunit amino acid transport system permease subunit
MFKIDSEGLRINQFRLIHSKKFRWFRFIKSRNELKTKDDLRGLNELITGYLIEKNEIDFTLYNIFLGLSFSLIGIIIVLFLCKIQLPWVILTMLGFSFILYILANKKKDDFVLGEMGIDISDDYFKQKIKEKFNL